MVVLKTGTLVGACYEVVANPAGMINPPLSVFEEQLGVLFQCQDDYQGSRRDPQVKGKTPTDVVERKRSLAVVLTHKLWPEEVYPLLSCRSGEATAQPQQLVLRDRVHAVTRVVVEEGRRETLTVLKELEEGADAQEAVRRLEGLVDFTVRREA